MTWQQSPLTDAFIAQFGGQPRWITRAPGRVNLIGDHTDYNQGFVLPMAIDRSAAVALRPRQDRLVRVQALNFGETAELDLDNLEHVKGWAEYAVSVAWALQSAGIGLQGWEGVIDSDVPIGSGLSSSAAFEVAMARAFCAAAGAEWKPSQIARLMQKAENDWVGVSSGIMDPLISAIAEPGRAALIDCRDLRVRHVRMPAGVSVVVMNTMKPRGLVDSAYNQRRRQCEQAAASFGVDSLRDVKLDDLLSNQRQLDDVIFRRARHVLTENERVLQFCAALEKNDLPSAGQRMNESHASLRDDFEVSCAELDAIVAAAQAQDGCFGARMTGAGFGGCAVALVQQGAAPEFEAAVAANYESALGKKPELISTKAVAGAQLVELNSYGKPSS